MAEPLADGSADALLGRVGKLVTGRPLHVLVVGGLLAVIGSPGAVQLPATCSSRAGSASGTPSSRARKIFQEKFPGRRRVDTYIGVVALQAHHNNKVSLAEVVEAPICSFANVECIQKSRLGQPPPSLLQPLQEAMLVEQKSIVAEQDEAPVLATPGIIDFSFDLNESLNQIHHISSFSSNTTSWYALGIPASDGFVSKDGTATLFLWTLTAKPRSKVWGDFADDAEDLWYHEVRKWLPRDTVETGVISGTITIAAAIDDTRRSMALMDMVALPLASMVLWYVLQSARLLLFPLLTSISSGLIGFGIMFMVAQVIDVAITTPTMMMSLTIAMSIDYSLFFLTRFRQELVANGGSEEEPSMRVTSAILATMPTAGFAIMLSGCILCASFSVIAIFPVTLLSSMGIGCAVVLAIMVMVHLTMGPALLALFPIFFSKCVSAEEVAAAAADQTLTASGTGMLASRRSGAARLFCALASFTAKPWAGALTVAVVSAATLIYGYVAVDLETTADFKMLIPRHSSAYHSFELMEKTFGAGNLAHLDLTMVVNSSYSTVMQQIPWEDSQRALQTMVKRLPFTDGIGISSPTYFVGPQGIIAFPWAAVGGCRALAQIAPPSPQCSLLGALATEFVSKDNRAIYARITLSVDPLGAHGQKFVRRARDLLAKLEHSTCFDFYLGNSPAETLDNIEKVIDLFPVMVIITFSAAMIMLGVAYRSLVMPLRSLTSIVLTLLWVYGGAVRIYQHGLLNWLGWSAVEGKLGAQYWLMPVSTFSVVVGLCLDYDVFLLTRVTECREQGMTTKEAVEEGLCSTGGTITAAGLIMTIAFSGMLYCTDVKAMNISGFYMVSAVLYDTLIVRCLMVPATMTFLGRWNWWPSELSEGKD